MDELKDIATKVRDFTAKLFGFKFDLKVVEKTYKTSRNLSVPFNVIALRIAAREIGIPFTADEEATNFRKRLEKEILANNNKIPLIQGRVQKWITYYMSLIQAQKEMGREDVLKLHEENKRNQERIETFKKIFEQEE